MNVPDPKIKKVKCEGCGTIVTRKVIKKDGLILCSICRQTLTQQNRRDRFMQLDRVRQCSDCGHTEPAGNTGKKCLVCKGKMVTVIKCEECGKWFPIAQRSKCYECMPRISNNPDGMVFPEWAKKAPNEKIAEFGGKDITLRNIVMQESLIHPGFAKHVLLQCETYEDVMTARDIFHGHRGHDSCTSKLSSIYEFENV